MFIVLLVLGIALTPAFLLMLYIYYRDRIQPEPIGNLLLGLFFGTLSIPLTLIMTFFLPEVEPGTVFAGFYDAFIGAAIPEEIAKFTMLFLLVFRMKSFDEPFDGIVYASCVGLGFAGVENIMYLAGGEDLGEILGMGIARAFLAVPGHFSDALAMGYFFAMAWFGSPRRRVMNYVLALAVPITMHGIYDSLLMVGENLGDVVFLFTFLLCIVYSIAVFALVNWRISVLRTPKMPAVATPMAMPPMAPPPVPVYPMTPPATPPAVPPLPTQLPPPLPEQDDDSQQGE
ncbi:PrsW family intramembrane metalloprotease [Sodaliphilus sp.]|uniref:PrsW family intramembrane metalloprotease n=1 Tax=Sodaliphilus sp. TaxID=2815818 RepID=UPI00388F841D